MTVLYKPVLIESGEQAEALPIGTLAKRPQHYSIEKVDECPDEWTDTCNAELRTSSDVVGWTALVPIEAEEETRNDSGLRGCETEQDFVDYLDGKRVHTMTRLVTPWEEA